MRKLTLYVYKVLTAPNHVILYNRGRNSFLIQISSHISKITTHVYALYWGCQEVLSSYTSASQ